MCKNQMCQKCVVKDVLGEIGEYKGKCYHFIQRKQGVKTTVYARPTYKYTNESIGRDDIVVFEILTNSLLINNMILYRQTPARFKKTFENKLVA